MKEKNKNKRRWLLVLAGSALVLLLIGLLLTRFEGEKPEMDVNLSSSFIGKSADLAVTVGDKKSGLRKIWVGLVQDGKEVVLVDSGFPSAGIISGGKIENKTLEIKFEPQKSGITDGPAFLRLAVWDYSWRGWWQGNQTYIEKNLTIDTQPPEIEVMSRAHNLTQGGAGLVIYRTSEICPQTGIQVGSDFYPGHAGAFKDPQVHMAFLGLNYQQGPQTQIFVTAVDRAGNSAKSGLNHHIRKKVFKKDTVEVSDRFLGWKIPEFEQIIASNSAESMVDKFLKINRDLRQTNYNQIVELTKTTSTAIQWEGSFLRMPGAAPQAGFADHREYRYKGKLIDRQVHLGIDLASVTHAQVPAANSGTVIFTGDLGIYGKTILIDHGIGLFSMYSHLNRFDVQKGQRVSKGQALGRTGTTGLAGGDHLHFSILIHSTFVNPIEWWDAAWIQNNILAKIEAMPASLKRE